MTDTTTITDTTQEVTEATQQAVKQVNQITQYLQDSIPGLITFGLEVLAALVAFFIGRLVIKWIRKIVRRSFERSEADKGVEQFVDSLLKYGLYGILIFCLISSLGFDTTSVAALLASSGVAIGLALQGSLSNFAGGVLILLLKPFVVGDYEAAEALSRSQEMYWRIFIWQNMLWRWIRERPVTAVFFLMKAEGSAVWRRRSLSSIFQNQDG